MVPTLERAWTCTSPGGRGLSGRAVLCAGCVLGLVIAGAPARALDEFDASGFSLATDPFGYLQGGGAHALEPWQVHAALGYGFAHRPLSFDGDSVGTTGDLEVVRDIHVATAALGVGLLRLPRGGISVGLSLPLVVDWTGLERPGGAYGPGTTSASGLGDLRAEGKACLLDRDVDALGVAARAWTCVPTGARDLFTSAGGAFRLGAEATVEKKIDFFRAGLSLGWEWLDGRFRGPSGTVDDRLTLTASLAITPLRDIAGWEGVEVCFEARHWTPSARPWASEDLSPLEAMGGLRYSGTFFGLVAAGGRLNQGLGAPDARFEAAVGVTF